MKPQRLIVQSVCTDDHRGWQVGRLEDASPRRDQLAVTGKDDGPGRGRRDIRRDLPSTVVFKRLGDELARYGRHWRDLLLVPPAAALVEGEAGRYCVADPVAVGVPREAAFERDGRE